MFKLITCRDVVRIPPEAFGQPLSEAARKQLKLRYEGIIDKDLGYVIAVLDVNVNPLGKIVMGDGATYHRVTFTLLTFYPMLNEIVEGEVVEVQDFGAFVRIGPMDALLHISQIMDDVLAYDERHGILTGERTGRRLREGDWVRARITAVSLARGWTAGKIGITTRQPFLGKLEWIEEDVKKHREAAMKLKKTGG